MEGRLDKPRPVAEALLRQKVTWDGKDFAVHVEKKTLPAGATAVEL